MENASKALIIAAAILLSILIIALGMRVYNSSSSVAEGTDMTAQEINAFNSTFREYEGNQKGSVVKSLLTKIQTNNSQYEDRQISVFQSTTTKRTSGQISGSTEPANIKLDNNASKIDDLRSNLKDNVTYTVKYSQSESGLIYAVYIWVRE